MKRILTLILGLVLSITTSAVFLSADKFIDFSLYETPSETFVGCLSDSLYSSKSEAAKNFLSNELVGLASQPIYLGYSENGYLSNEQIQELVNITNVQEEFLSAEKITIHYSDNERNQDVNTCFLESNDGYKYFTYIPDNNTPLTNSYFNSVFDGVNYLNCTATTTYNTRIVSEEINTDSIYRQTFEFDNKIAHLDQQIPGIALELYFSEQADGIHTYLTHPQKSDGLFYSLDEINASMGNGYYSVFLLKGDDKVDVSSLSTMEEVTDFIFMMNVDASFFIKTPYGFTLPDYKCKALCKTMVGEESYKQIDDFWEEYEFYINADYYVSHGRLSSSKTVLTMSDGENLYYMTISTNFTDFGVTSVDLPNK